MVFKKQQLSQCHWTDFPRISISHDSHIYPAVLWQNHYKSGGWSGRLKSWRDATVYPYSVKSKDIQCHLHLTHRVLVRTCVEEGTNLNKNVYTNLDVQLHN